MTREEASNQINDIKTELAEHLLKKDIEALDIAISALSADGEYIKKEDISRVLLARIGANKSCSSKASEYGHRDTEQYFNNLLFEDEQITSLIEGLPSASLPDSAENKGEWKMPIQDDGMSDPIYYQVRCSRCGFDIDPQTWYEELHQFNADNFCPKCGADMRGKAK